MRAPRRSNKIQNSAAGAQILEASVPFSELSPVLRFMPHTPRASVSSSAEAGEGLRPPSICYPSPPCHPW